MKKPLLFQGVATALVTPTNADGVDYAHLGALIDFQLEARIPALVVCATTGEAPTLTDDEHLRVLSFAVERCAGRAKIIAGTGSNDTAHAIMMTKQACSIGCDGILVVSPYYNKPTQLGIRRSYEAIADASTKPVILYNVPSRTSVRIEPETYAALADHPMIVAIKEAGGDFDRLVHTMALVGDRLAVYSGEDATIVPLLAMGGMGVVSVVSNILPRETIAMCDRFFAGDIAGAAEMQCRLYPLVKALFSETSPAPAKAALSAMGYCEDYLRLPLVPMQEPNRTVLFQQLRQWGLPV